MQRYPTFAVPLFPTHFGTTESTAALHPNAEGAGLHRGLHGALHCATEAHATGELVRNALSNQRGVELRLLDLLNVEMDLRVPGDLQQSGAEPIGLGATATDDDSWPRGVHVHAQPITGAFDLDPTHHGAQQLGAQIVPDLPVLDEEFLVFLVLSEPPRFPIGRDTEAEPVRVDLLTHYCAPFDESSDSSVSASATSDSSPVPASSTASPASVSLDAASLPSTGAASGASATTASS